MQENVCRRCSSVVSKMIHRIPYEIKRTRKFDLCKQSLNCVIFGQIVVCTQLLCAIINSLFSLTSKSVMEFSLQSSEENLRRCLSLRKQVWAVRMSRIYSFRNIHHTGIYLFINNVQNGRNYYKVVISTKKVLFSLFGGIW